MKIVYHGSPGAYSHLAAELIFPNYEYVPCKTFEECFKLCYENDNYKKEIEIPFKIIVGNAEAIKGTYNGNEIDFMANANRLTKVNIINFDENKLD